MSREIDPRTYSVQLYVERMNIRAMALENIPIGLRALSASKEMAVCRSGRLGGRETDEGLTISNLLTSPLAMGCYLRGRVRLRVLSFVLIWIGIGTDRLEIGTM